MKPSTFVLLCSFTLLAYSITIAQSDPTPPARTSGASPSPSGLHLNAHFVADKVSVGSAVILEATIENDGTTPVTFYDFGGPTQDLRVSITDSRGRIVPETAWGREQAVNLMGKQEFGYVRIDRHVAPGKEFTFQLLLNRQFDMSETGTYKVVLWGPDIVTNAVGTDTSLQSNEAEVDLTEPSP